MNYVEAGSTIGAALGLSHPPIAVSFAAEVPAGMTSLGKRSQPAVHSGKQPWLAQL